MSISSLIAFVTITGFLRTFSYAIHFCGDMWPANVKEIQVRHFHTWLKLSWDNIWGFSDCPYIQTAKPCMLTWVNISWPNSTVNRLSFLLSHPEKKKHCCFDTMQWIHTLKNQTKLSILLLFRQCTATTNVMLHCVKESAKPSAIKDPHSLHSSRMFVGFFF